MGFLEDFNVDPNDFTSEFEEAPAGRYEFIVNNGKLYTNDKGESSIQISFNLENGDGETFNKTWWLSIPVDPEHPTVREKRSMSDWKNWCLGAGFKPDEIRTVGPDDVEGITGTVNLVQSKPNKEKKTYVNFRDWSFDGAPEKAPEPPRKASKAPAAAKPAASKSSASKPNPFAKD